jgi:DNA helicase-2/ATP-dependent DNA helicase PcrA
MSVVLNPKQQEAANILGGNLLIIAGAGTGKTTTIVERFKNLVEKKHLLPDEILMTTFTNKAAKDMIKKIHNKTGIISPWVGTMHSLFLKILRNNQHVIFNGKPYTIITDSGEQRKIIREILNEQGIKSHYDAVQYFTRWIGKFKNRGILAEDLSWEGGIDEAKKRGEITEMLDDELISVDPMWRSRVNLVYKKYQEFLHNHYLMDFDEILLLTHKLLSDNPEILKIYKDQFQAIMVDEAQDLNVIQVKILNLLKKNNLCLIGDDCQNIYEWRGSSNDLVFDFQENEKQIYLEDNYRSNKEILSGVNKIIESMKNKIDKTLKNTRESGNEINIVPFHHANQEMEWVADEVEELIESGENPEEIAILFRTNRIGKSFERVFRRRQIPCHLAKTIDFFDREEIKDSLSFLKLKQNPHSRPDFERIVSLVKGLGKAKVKKMIEYSRQNNKSLIDSLNVELNFPANVETELRTLYNAINSSNYFYDFLEEFGYYEYLDEKYEEEPRKLEDKYQNISVLFDLHKFNKDSLGEFLDSLIEIDKKEKTDNKVILSTIHGAKGLEWKHVFLVFANEKTLPFYKDILEQGKKDSELRLFYVAISRAKDNLVITSSVTEGYNWNRRSQFIDILEELIN